ncbi:MAG: T9SS C-terminal target domain-containing protein [Balneola sp.]|nr:MAG: T9SS C-terminal target domain-containing protein [Balneola sp.]
MFIRRVVVLLMLFLGGEVAWAQTDSIAPTLNDSLLTVFLRTNYTASSPKDYDEARDSMYTSIDVDATDSLTCVYSGLRAEADGTRTPSNGSLSFNTEHSWPQSFYDNNEPMRGDIHHLYPTWSSPNQSRSNHPFAEIDDNLTTSWWFWENGASVSSIPSSNIDEYSEYYNDTFEPREDHKGNVARAMFYFWTIYQTNSDIINDDFDNEAFFEGMKQTLYQWHQDDPVNAAEVARSLHIEEIQGNRNPFIHDTTLVRRAYFNAESSSSSNDIYISEVYEANGGTVKYLELFNNSDSTINLSTSDWALLRYTNANTSPSSTISLTGEMSPKSFLVVGDDNSTNGVQTVFGEGFVDINTSSINHNGNDKYVLVKNATSTPDTIDSFARDNIGNSSSFATNQVAYRIESALPNDGSFGQTSISNDGDTVSSGYWVVFDISSSNANARLVATPGYNRGIEATVMPETIISGSIGWRLLSIPMDNATLSEISDDTAIQGVDDSAEANVFTYNSSGSFETPASTSTTLTNGEGLVLYFFDNDTLGSSSLPIKFDVSGDEPSSDVSVNLNTSTAESGSYFTLVGNPFQSNYDANSITPDNPLQTNIHFLEGGLYSPETASSTIISPWQGFWVESGTTTPATSITFPTSGKVNSSATIHSFSKDPHQTFDAKFNLRSSSSFDKGCKITFSSDAVFGWDLLDASKLSPATETYAILGCQSGDIIKSAESIPFDMQSAYHVDFFIESKNVDELLELEWDIDEELTHSFTFELVDHKNGTLIDLEKYQSIPFNFEPTIVSKANREGFSPGKIIGNELTTSNYELIITQKVSVGNGTEEDHPKKFDVPQNYPNPFNPSTLIRFNIPKASEISITIFDIRGSLVQTLTRDFYSSGTHSVSFNGDGLATGVYFYTVTSSFGSITRKMLLAK